MFKNLYPDSDHAGVMTTPQLFQCLRFTDANRAIAFFSAIGFQERLLVRDDQDPDGVVHAQFQWRDNGGIMFGSVRPDDDSVGHGHATTNLVLPSDDDVDAVLARALAAGATQDGPIRTPDHGGRSVAVVDFDGNLWHLDSYPGV